jgi:PhnB protein
MTADSASNAPASVAIAPMLSVRGGSSAVRFYVAAFNAVEVYRFDDPDAGVVARLSIDGAVFWVTDEAPEQGNPGPETLGGGTVRLILTVPDPDATFARAVAAGAQEVFAVEEAHGWRLGRVVDPFGHHWEIGRLLGDQA